MISRIRYFRVNDAGQRTEEVILHFPGLPQSYVESDGEEWITWIQLLDNFVRNLRNSELDSI